jgi:hypothetical protein
MGVTNVQRWFIHEARASTFLCTSPSGGIVLGRLAAVNFDHSFPGRATMTLDWLLDPELDALIAPVKEAFGTEALSRAIENSYAAVVRGVGA